jgi:NitT/TauT family transport system substrate-binding protein
VAPYYLAEALLHGEGFTEVQHVQTSVQIWTPAVVSGEVDFVLNFVGPLLVRLDAGDPLVMLAGVHVGCFELFGTDRVRAIRDLKGKTVSVPELGSPQHVFLASIAAYVGLDPRKDINWVIHSRADAMQRLTDGTSMPSSDFRQNPRNCGRRGSGTWWSTARWTDPGRNTSAAWSTPAGHSPRSTRWRPNGRCAPF